MSTKNLDMCASWDMESDRHTFLSFWAIFCPFTPLLRPKIKIWKKCKKTAYFILLHMCTINEDHMMYGCWDVRHDGQSFLSFLSQEKKVLGYFHFTQVYQKSWSYAILLWRYGMSQMQWFFACVPKIIFCTLPHPVTQKWHIEVGAPPKK